MKGATASLVSPETATTDGEEGAELIVTRDRWLNCHRAGTNRAPINSFPSRDGTFFSNLEMGDTIEGKKKLLYFLRLTGHIRDRSKLQWSTES